MLDFSSIVFIAIKIAKGQTRKNRRPKKNGQVWKNTRDPHPSRILPKLPWLIVKTRQIAHLRVFDNFMTSGSLHFGWEILDWVGNVFPVSPAFRKNGGFLLYIYAFKQKILKQKKKVLASKLMMGWFLWKLFRLPSSTYKLQYGNQSILFSQPHWLVPSCFHDSPSLSPAGNW